MARDYTYDKAYRRAHLAEDASRHRARRLMIKKHGKSALKGKDVDHKDGNPLNGSTRNLAITSKHFNRAKH
jgi:hypothetical protein